MESELFLEHRSSSIVRFQIRRANFEKKCFEDSMDCICELSKRIWNCSLVSATADEQFFADVLRTNNVQQVDADRPQDSMEHRSQLSWTDGDD